MERNDDQSVPLTLKKIYEPVVQIGQVFCFREAKLIEFKGLRRWRSLIAAAQMQTPIQTSGSMYANSKHSLRLPRFSRLWVASAERLSRSHRHIGGPGFVSAIAPGVHYPGPLSRELDIPVRISRLSYREW
jgi:hypothetical protein